MFTKKITAFKETGNLENLKSESDGNLIITVFYKYITGEISIVYSYIHYYYYYSCWLNGSKWLYTGPVFAILLVCIVNRCRSAISSPFRF